MAASTDQEAGAKKAEGFSLVAFLIATVLAGGGGAFFALQIPTLMKTGGADKASEPVAQSEVLHSPIIDLAPITTNLGEPAGTWVRLEAAVVAKEDLGPDRDVLLRKISEDIIAYFRTVKLIELSEPSSFQHMLEDLNERVRIRSENKIDSIVIQSFILE